MSRLSQIAVSAFVDGLTGAGLFGKLRRPGAPNVLVDHMDAQYANPHQVSTTLRRTGKSLGDDPYGRAARADAPMVNSR